MAHSRRRLNLSLLVLGLVLGGALTTAAPALAATGTLSCSVTDDDVTCAGTTWTPETTVTLCLNSSDECAPGWLCTFLVSPTTDVSGDFTGALISDVTAGTYYAYGSEDSCSTSTAATENPLIIEAPPEPTCGDSVIESPETCDDGDTDAGDGCSASCAVETGWTCTEEPSVCVENGQIIYVPTNVEAVREFFAIVLPLALIVGFFLIAFVL